jgi:hypothetical protein
MNNFIIFRKNQIFKLTFLKKCQNSQFLPFLESDPLQNKFLTQSDFLIFVLKKIEQCIHVNSAVLG